MQALILLLVVVVLVIGAALSARIIKQYEQGVLFRLGRVRGPRDPGLRRVPDLPGFTQYAVAGAVLRSL